MLPRWATLPHNSPPKTVFTITFCKRPLADVREVVVVQLQLLDLMIPKECGAVPMDAATRADLIDLMARVLVVVFHEEGEEPMTEVCWPSSGAGSML